MNGGAVRLRFIAAPTFGHRDNLASLAGDNGAKVLGPTGEGDGFLLGIKSAVIDTGHAGTVAANVIKDSLDDMRCNPQVFVHPGTDGSPQIMQSPSCDCAAAGNTGVEQNLAIRLACKAICPKNMFTASKAGASL